MSSNITILAFVGMPGSGKGTCTDYLHEKYGWPVVHFGNMVYEEVQRRGLDNVADEVFVREDMRKIEGAAVLAKHAAKKAKGHIENAAEVVLLDGLYSWAEYKHLQEEFGDKFVVIAVTAEKKTRRQRVLDRKDAHRKYTLEQLIKRELAEIENLDKGAPIAYADYTLTNDGDTTDLIENLENILKTLQLI